MHWKIVAKDDCGEPAIIWAWGYCGLQNEMGSENTY